MKGEEWSGGGEEEEEEEEEVAFQGRAQRSRLVQSAS